MLFRSRRRIGGRSKLRRMVEAPSRLLLGLLERHDGVARDDRQQLVFGRRNRHVERHAKKIEFETQSLRQRPEHYPFVAHFRAFRHRHDLRRIAGPRFGQERGLELPVRQVVALILKLWWQDIVRQARRRDHERAARSEEHTSELQSLMRISYARYSLK